MIFLSHSKARFVLTLEEKHSQPRSPWEGSLKDLVEFVDLERGCTRNIHAPQGKHRWGLLFTEISVSWLSGPSKWR